MKFYLTTLVILFSSLQIICQHHHCGTTTEDQSTTVDFLKNYNPEESYTSTRSLTEVPVQMHIIGSNNGIFAIDTLIVLNELEILNEYFSDIDITFVMCNDINFIYDNDLVTFIKEESEWICDQEDAPGAINIYYTPQLDVSNGESICGYAPNFDIRPRVFLDNNCVGDGAILAHEVGHSFSLWHTHRFASGAELVSGSNCDIAGDLLCDTPADPLIDGANVNSNCQYIGTELDAEQNPYNPDTGNVMSYSPKECVNNFSSEQYLQMRVFYNTNQLLLNCLGPPTSNVDEKLKAIKVYPNPSREILFIENTPPSSIIQIWNVHGQLLTTKENNTNLDLIEIKNFSGFNNGIYYLKIYHSDSFTSKRIIKI